MLHFSKGLLIGISMAAPVGPVSILCIRRTLSHGFWLGVATGLGAATADGIFALIAAFGITSISQFLTAQTWWLELVGGLFLIFLGIRAFWTQPVIELSGIKKKKLTTSFMQSFLLTLTNPMTLVAFTVVFASLGITQPTSNFSAAKLATGVFIGSALWFTTLSGLVYLCRSYCTPYAFVQFHKISALLLACFGVLLVVMSILHWL